MRWVALVLLAAACGSSSSPPPADDAGDDDDGVDAPPAPPDADPTTPPTFETEFDGNDGVWTERAAEGGAVAFAVADGAAGDGLAATLTFDGDPAFAGTDRVTPAFATEIDSTATFHFGRYRARLQVAACDATEEVVTGYFTYQNDGVDHDADGLVDNDEIDIEILCGTPTVIFLSSWTDYDETGFRKWTRAIDLSSGAIYESPSDHEYGLVPAGNDPALALPGLIAPDGYVELGFDWAADHIRFVAIVDGAPVTLWNFTDAALIPQKASPWLFNVWHPGEHWFGGGAAPDHPAADAVVHLDWARYWAE